MTAAVFAAVMPWRREVSTRIGLLSASAVCRSPFSGVRETTVRSYIDAMNVIGSRPDGWWRDREERCDGSSTTSAPGRTGTSPWYSTPVPPTDRDRRARDGDHGAAPRPGRRRRRDRAARRTRRHRRHLRRERSPRRVREQGADVEGAGSFQAEARVIASERRRAARRGREDARGRRGGRRHQRLRALLPPARGGRDGPAAGGLDRAGRATLPAPRRPALRSRRRARGAGQGDRAAPQRRPRDEHGPRPARSRCWRPRTGSASWTSSPARCCAPRASTAATLPLVLHGLLLAPARTRWRRSPRYEDLDIGLPLDFLQNKEPKLLVEDLTPAEWPANPALEWCPPGHGDLYTALRRPPACSQDLLERGFEYAFVANSDNLGAVARAAHPDLAGAPTTSRSSWRSPSARRPTARAATSRGARPTAGSCCARPPRRPRRTSRRCRTSAAPLRQHQQPVGRACARWTRRCGERDGVLGLPMIRNQKTVDPGDKSSPEVFQIETAMGAADRGLRRRPRAGRPAHALRAGQDHRRPAGAALGRLPADRRLTRGARPRPPPDRHARPRLLQADARLRRALPDGPVSLAEADRFEVDGDVTFGADVVARGSVKVEGPATIEAGTGLTG